MKKPKKRAPGGGRKSKYGDGNISFKWNVKLPGNSPHKGEAGPKTFEAQKEIEQLLEKYKKSKSK